MSSEFPVHWDDPADARLFFVHERSHFPGQVRPLDFDLNVKFMEYGFNRAAEHYRVPLNMLDRWINTYVYEAIGPRPATVSSDETEARLDEAIARLQSLWEADWLPEIQAHLAHWEAYPLAETALEPLIQHLRASLARLERVWELHFVMFFPMMVALSRFETLHADLFGETEALGVYRLLAGFKSKTVAANEALWQLSQTVRQDEHLTRLVLDTPAGELRQILAADAAGQEFLARLAEFLAAYGRRSNEWSIDRPFWIEEPAPALAALGDFLRDPERDPLADFARAVREREAAEASARESLRNYPQPVVAEFEHTLAAAQMASFLSEESFFWIEGLVSWQIRRLCLAIGRELVRGGVLQQKDQVFYLHLEELLEMPPAGDLAARIAARQADEARCAALHPPETLGTPPTEPPPADPVSQALAQFYGEPPAQPEAAGHWLGFPASPGVARGTARIIHSLTEAGRVRPGDVLVAPTTAPPWTSLFATIAALVTDTGGVLSHGAIVAREYGIPAVVGVGVATTSIQDGQLIEINGSTGEIHLVPENV